MKNSFQTLCFLCILLFGSQNLFAQRTIPRCAHFNKHVHAIGNRDEDQGNLRSDTLDILKYTISLDMTQMDAQTIKGACTIDLRSKMNGIDWINLDLLNLQVDSITSGGNQLVYTHEDGLIHTTLNTVLNMNDAYQLTVYYHGTPATDASFGGFYFQNTYAYNLGVAFNDDPHNYGRAWFPCFDNFVERSAYDMQVLTNNGRTAYCGGVRTAVETVGQDSLLTSWSLEQEIPTYLASVAVSNYTHVDRSFESISGETIPIWLTAKPADTTAMKQSFINVASCAEGFEDDYGQYHWPRVGFVLVPFNGGAMEHATNIAYPRITANGTLTYETLMAHELSHHWFGDLVTCRNAEDMWLNEGWAQYSEAIFTENQYGPTAYRNWILNNHKDALVLSHIADGGYYPVSGIPTQITYGYHVYTKGSDMAHTLRGYMGDDDFFTAVKAYLEQYQFSDVNSEEMRDFFQQYTDANLTSFFDDWIFQEGFPEFRIRQTTNTSGNNWEVIVDQFHHHNPELYENVPMQLTVLDNTGNRHYFNVLLSGATTTLPVTLGNGVVPAAFFLNENDAISEAVLAENKVITNTSMNTFAHAEAGVNVMNFGGAQSVFARVENHFAEANPGQTQAEFFISPDRWWNIYHDAPEGAAVHCLVKFYGNSAQPNYFDPQFFQYMTDHSLPEDSMIIVYRPDGVSPWVELEEYYVNPLGNNTNWNGEIAMLNIRPGQYAWAVKTGLSSIAENTKVVDMYYNQRAIVIATQHKKGSVSIYDAMGKLVNETLVTGNTEIPVRHLSKGTYQAHWKGENKENTVIRFVVE